VTLENKRTAPEHPATVIAGMRELTCPGIGGEVAYKLDDGRVLTANYIHFWRYVPCSDVREIYE
jgi:hypothetical protein